MIWWLAIAAGAYFGRNQISKVLAPILGAESAGKTVFYGHLLTLICAVCYIFPLELVGLGRFKKAAYNMSLWSVVMTAIYVIKMNYGFPDIPGGINMSNWKQVMANSLQPWLQKVMTQGIDFHFLFLGMIFLNAYPSVAVLLILGRRSLWNCATYCSKNTPESRIWLMCKPSWDRMKASEPEILLYSALAEIVLGIWLIASLALPQRQILTTILYWNFLKTRYQVPRSQPMHLKAWMLLGAQAEPVLSRVPILRKPLDYAKDWFRPQVQYRQG